MLVLFLLYGEQKKYLLLKGGDRCVFCKLLLEDCYGSEQFCYVNREQYAYRAMDDGRTIYNPIHKDGPKFDEIEYRGLFNLKN